MNPADEEWMRLALAEAHLAAERGEVPVGAVVIGADGALLARQGNRCIEADDPSGHAEIIALRRAGQTARNYRLTGATLYVTLEPCLMCAGAMIHARIGRLVYGAADPKTGAVASLYQVAADPRLNHVFAVEGGVLAEDCAQVLRLFFQAKRAG